MLNKLTKLIKHNKQTLSFFSPLFLPFISAPKKNMTARPALKAAVFNYLSKVP